MPRWVRVLSVVAALGFTVSTLAALSGGDARVAAMHAILATFCWWPFVTWFRHRHDAPDAAPDGLAPEDLRDRGARRWLLPVALLAVVGVLGLIGDPAALFLPGYLLVIAGITLWRVRVGGDEVDFTDDALVVRPRKGEEKRYAWGDVLELSWSPLQWPTPGAGPVARVRGGAFETPGPTAPAQLATVVLAGYENRRWGREQVRRAAARHGIPFTDDLITVISTGRRKPRLPGESS